MTKVAALTVAVVAAVIFGGVAGSVPAAAEPVNMAPKSYDKISRDGWTLNITLNREIVVSVPNLANAPDSREAFITVSGTATATGGPGQITDSLFIVGYQLGCQRDVSTGLQYGGTGGVAPEAAVNLGTGIGAPPGVEVGNFAGAAGFVQTVVQPGVIVDLPLSNMALGPGGQAMIDIDNIHVKADACGGDVTIRSYGYLRISTSAAHTQFAVYGDPIKI